MKLTKLPGSHVGGDKTGHGKTLELGQGAQTLGLGHVTIERDDWRREELAQEKADAVAGVTGPSEDDCRTNRL